MAIDIAVTLSVRDHSTDNPASLVDIAGAAGQWAELEISPEELVHGGNWSEVGRKRAQIVAEKIDLGGDDAWAWRMQFAHADGKDPSVLWVVEIEALEDPNAADTAVSVTLGRERRDQRVRLFRTDTPMPPGVTRAIVEASGLECLDGETPLSGSPSTLARSGVDDFASQLLFARDRRLPVIGISHRPSGEPFLSAERLARALAGMAHVWLIPPETTWALSALLPERLGVYNGAVRIWWPGFRSGDTPRQHALLLPGSSERPVEEIVETVTAAARAGHRPLGGLDRLRIELRRRESDRVLAELGELRAKAAAGQMTESIVDASLIEDLERSLRAVTNDREAALVDLVELEAELSQRDAEVKRLEWDVLSLKERLRGAGLAEIDTEVGAEPAAAFLDEIRDVHAMWLVDDRTRFPLQPMRLHPEFLQALDRLEGIARPKVIEVCAQVASGRAKEIPGRDLHQLRVSRGAGAPQRVRSLDGAKAWRCALQRETPSARRLHWWVLADGTIEFAHVGVHDDERCPE
ncbi:hypothetical protein [Miltoncostaea oceani]|uniref:hypothetical protein n=1 Tax=Miltoncostaea oceani TaxID=2843216 RepID=UPI001C3C6074|nr:hypothetical protein [Miltoncostaea oceani]